MNLKTLTAGALTISLLFLANCAPKPTEAAADLVFINGKVFTADNNSTVVEAFAVSDGKFLGVGTSDDIRKQFVGADTQVVDLKGRFVTPGLTDNHFHGEGGGANVDLSRVRTMAELQSAIGAVAAKAAPGQVIMTNSDWHEAQLKEQRLPVVADLDAISTTVPIVVIRGGHSIFLNSAALNKYNITKATPVPAGGAIPRDERGELTGELVDNAKRLVELPKPSTLTYADVLATQKALNPYGITAVRIPGGYKSDTVAAFRFMREAAAKGELNLRYTFMMPGSGLRSPADVEKVVNSWGVKMNEGDDMVRVDGVKLIVDGGFEGGHLTTPYKEPYGRGGTFHGLVVVQPAPYTGVVRELHRLGWRVTTHAVGDAGIDQVIAAYETVNAEKPIAGQRWAIEHAFVSRPDQFDKLKSMGIYLAVQDHLYVAAPSLKKYWGMEVAEKVTPLKSYLDAGLPTSVGTDSPVIPYNPFFVLYHFLTRDTISDGIYGSSEAVTSRAELLKTMTVYYADLIGERATKGSIEPGKLADFAVLTADFLTVPAAEVPKMKALATYVGGREVYRDPAFN
jgi:predicted amidohydrolase YtcJ